MGEATTRLFVYGTLAPGRKNHHLLADLRGEWSAATLRGHLLDEGWGAQMGYPGIVPSADGEVVAGHVFSSPELHDHWATLDEFEGAAYRRVEVAVTLDEGQKAQAWVYALDRDTTVDFTGRD